MTRLSAQLKQEVKTGCICTCLHMYTYLIVHLHSKVSGYGICLLDRGSFDHCKC